MRLTTLQGSALIDETLPKRKLYPLMRRGGSHRGRSSAARELSQNKKNGALANGDHSPLEFSYG